MFIRLLLSTLLLMPLYSCAEDKVEIQLDTLEQKAAYAFGVTVASQIKSQNIDLDVNTISLGLTDSLQGNELRLTQEQMKQAHTEFIAQSKAVAQEQQQALAANNLEAGNQFLKENATKEGVVTTDSGLQYKIITTGSGASPKETDTVITHYRGSLMDGREFDSSYKRNTPATFPVKGVIKGWTEALQLMKVGAKWQLFIPADLAYGTRKRSELIQPNTLLIFDLELLEIKS